ncbi:hypothetical protein GCM10010329_02240 [Streptomyces spiroverticillatus]|uniref:Uncharacterized protein n=1 Tax=Streptomyces finlayi TaxID=67296 RepID=A0A918WS82_9ACTN|nr:hypothetical protein [Streptomyces finlayi]GGZ86122.1 hypothetical protein GCM10010329_02240 [Streptomyces spiroverticillatus]GHC77620.1 hypothetical protein GCM10010334_02230 [Streptomyces finlayi]
MSLHEELTELQESLDRLERSVLRLTGRIGESHPLDVRRVRTDAAHLRESVAMLSALAAAGGATGRGPSARAELITIPDAPYDSALWTDSDDEGLGARNRHAP